MASRNVIKIFRELMRMTYRLPKGQRIKAVQQIREGFQKNKDVTDPTKIEAMLTKANSSFGYLKIVTPKVRMNGFEKADAGQSGKSVSNWHGGNMDPDSVKRHFQGLTRAGFKDNTHAKGGFF